jgi:hypothetical protein
MQTIFRSRASLAIFSVSLSVFAIPLSAKPA